MKYYQKHTALGSTIELCIVSDQPRHEIDALYQALWHMIFSFEKQYSRFLPASELSFFNRRAGTRHTISASFREVLQAAQVMAHKTDSLFNPFILPALQAAGYQHSLVSGHEHDAVDDHSHRRVVPITELEIGDTWAKIPFGTALDFGGHGKGYLADQLASIVPKNVQGFWFSLGGDIIAGGADEQGKPWRISIQHAGSPSQTIGSVIVPIGSRLAVATSGTMQRRGVKQGKVWHHLIDPRTLRPAITDMRIATVCASSALEADVFASCAVILNRHESYEFLKSRQVIAAALQYDASGRLATQHFGATIRIDEPKTSAV